MYAPAYAGIAMAHVLLTVVGVVDMAHAFRQAKASARRALELDETLPEAHAALALSVEFGDFNVAEGLREAKRGLDLNPNSGITRYAYAQALACAGRLDEAVEHGRISCEIDPLMAPLNYSYGLYLYYQHRWAEAEVQIHRTLDINPNFVLAQTMLGVTLARAGRFAEASRKSKDSRTTKSPVSGSSQ